MSDAGVFEHIRIALKNLYITSAKKQKVQMKINENKKPDVGKYNFW